MDEKLGETAAAVHKHVSTCLCCRETQGRFKILGQALANTGVPREDPAFVREVAQRLASSAPVPRFTLRPFLVAGAVMASVALAVVVRPRGGEMGIFTPRGDSSLPANERRLGFSGFVHVGGPKGAAAPLHEGQLLHPGDGLSFTLYNRSHKSQRVLLFAVDAQKDVHWFYPAYEDGRSNPGALSLPATPQVTSLSEGVVMEKPAVGKLVLVALFVDRDVRVAEVETALNGRVPERLPEVFPKATVNLVQLELVPSSASAAP